MAYWHIFRQDILIKYDMDGAMSEPMNYDRRPGDVSEEFAVTVAANI